jgi:hypothetical protein
VVRAAFDVTADEAEKMARGAHMQRPIVETFIQYEWPSCLAYGAVYEPGGSDECLAEKRVVTKVQF